MKKIAVLTSGGDAPGMNAAIRAVVRTAIYHGVEVLGIERGYSGLISGEVIELNVSSVADIIHRGGTILRTARSEEFRTPEGRAKAYQTMQRFGIDGLVVIGGDGSFKGAELFTSEYPITAIGIPGTIDNDIPCTDYTIGFDTAVNTVLDAINKIRDTATSHERTFIMEVMGRNSGYIALQAALAGGAESILIPEIKTDLSQVCEKLKKGIERGKRHSIILVAEGAGSAIEVGEYIKNCAGIETRVSILGHIQRGGTPSGFDRALAGQMGAQAVELLIKGENNKMLGMVNNKVEAFDISFALKQDKPINLEMFNTANVLSL